MSRDDEKEQLINELARLKAEAAAMRRRIEKHEKTEERLSLINECFLNYVADPLKNIEKLTALCGRLLEADCALYNRLDKGMLCSFAGWNAPPDFQRVDAPDGHICYDVIIKSPEAGLLVRDLLHSQYATSDPNVRKYNLQTYIGFPVKFRGECMGSICVVYTKDYEPSEKDMKILSIVASAIGVEEERWSKEGELQKSEKKLSDITSSLAEGIYVMDENGNITFMNQEAERLLGWTLDELKNRNAHYAVHYRKADGAALPLEDCAMRKVIITGRRYFSMNEVFVRRDGTVFPVSILSSPIVENGKVVASVTAFRDITERKKLENELLIAKKLESVGILAGGIAHDFNNLLQAILGYISLSKLHLNSTDKAYELMGRAEEASSKAGDLAWQLITFSEGGAPIRSANLVELLVKEAAAYSFEGSGVICKISLPDGLWLVYVDAAQVKQAIRNILINAREAMQDKGTVEIHAENTLMAEKDVLALREGKYVKVSVKDRGTGMPPEILHKIFDPYFTTKGFDSRKGKGLGLAVSYSIIKSHGGLISVESREGVGSVFHIYLPAL